MRVLLVLADDRKELNEFCGAAAGGGSTAGCVPAEALNSPPEPVSPSVPGGQSSTAQHKHNWSVSNLQIRLEPDGVLNIDTDQDMRMNARKTCLSQYGPVYKPSPTAHCCMTCECKQMEAPAAPSGSLPTLAAPGSTPPCELRLPADSASVAAAASWASSAVPPRRGSAASTGATAAAKHEGDGQCPYRALPVQRMYQTRVCLMEVGTKQSAGTLISIRTGVSAGGQRDR